MTALHRTMLRIHLSGRMAIECDGVRVDQSAIPGTQARALLALLVGERPGPTARAAIAEALWPAGEPAAWESALNALASRLRGVFGALGLDGAALLQGGGGCYELHLPDGTWVDHEVAFDAIHEAEAALRAGDVRGAYGPSAVAHHIARRPFLPAEQGRWFEQRRERLGSLLIRALECRAEVYRRNGEYPLAVEAARDAIARAPFREHAYRLLMRACAESGNAAEALQVYESCRRLLAEELGVGPSAETRALHLEIVRGM